MKALYTIVASLLLLSLSSCSTIDFAPEETSVGTLVSTYGATNLFAESAQADNLNLDELPSMTAAEAHAILGDIRKHQSSRKESRTVQEQGSNKVSFQVKMDETISGRHTFSLQLNFMKNTDGKLFYSGYEADCQSDSFKWYRDGHSFSSENNQSGCYKFKTQGYIYFKVVDGTVQYLKVPFMVVGTYNPATQGADFTYSL